MSLLFFVNGALVSTLLPRFPEIKAGFGLDDASYGRMVIAFAAGALLTTGLAGRVIRRLGVLRTSAVTTAVLAAALVVAGLAGMWPDDLAGDSAGMWPGGQLGKGAALGLLVAALMVGGAADGMADAAMNVQGVLVERWRGRSWVNSFHAVWSLGAACGGAIGALTAAKGIGLGLTMAVGGTVWMVVALIGCRLAAVPAQVAARLAEASTPTPETEPSARSGARPATGGLRRTTWRLLLPVGGLAIAGVVVEDVANNWAVLYLGRVAQAPLTWAGLGLTMTLLAQFVGRVLGDPMTDRFGRERVALAGGVLIAVGGLAVVTTPAYPVAFAGFALMGFGTATLVPAAFASAGRFPGLPEGTGIALLSWLMRLGFLLSSPVLGALSQATSLRTAMLLPLAAGLVAAAIAYSLLPTSSPPPSPAPDRPAA